MVAHPCRRIDEGVTAAFHEERDRVIEESKVYRCRQEGGESVGEPVGIRSNDAAGGVSAGAAAPMSDADRAVNDSLLRPIGEGIHTQSEGGMRLTPHPAFPLMHEVLALARRAGERIVEIAAGSYEVSTKSDQTPLTTADMAAHHIIVDGLRALDPDLPVLSEESEEIPFAERHGWPRHWLVDPLDGTREFIRGNGEFAVNIALVEGNRPLLGVVVAPVLDVAYFAARGAGAWKQCGLAGAEPIHVRPVPSDRPTVARSRCPVTGERLQRFLDELGEHDEIAMGASLKSCLVAEGVADVYARLGPTGEWDTAAAQVIVEEAGGHITDATARDLRYNERESLINPHFVVYGDDRIDWARHIA